MIKDITIESIFVREQLDKKFLEVRFYSNDNVGGEGLILGGVINLQLSTQPSAGQIDIPGLIVKETDRRFYGNRPVIVFQRELTQTLFYKIEEFRRGKNIDVNFEVQFWGLYHEYDQNGALGKVQNTFFCRESALGIKDRAFSMNREDWARCILQPYGFGNNLIVEIPINIPPLTSPLNAPQSIVNLLERLERAKLELNTAWNKFGSGDDDGTLMNTRMAIDALWKGFLEDKVINNNMIDELADFLFIGTDTASQNIASDMVQSFRGTIKEMWNLASKRPHSTSRGELIDYHPDWIDARTILGITTQLVSYLSAKAVKSTRYRK